MNKIAALTNCYPRRISFINKVLFTYFKQTKFVPSEHPKFSRHLLSLNFANIAETNIDYKKVMEEGAMDDPQFTNSLRERILNDLRNVVKQIYHESVNNELSPDNKTYICLTLIKNLDEALCHGLKQLHLGYWKPISKILHPETRQSVENLQSTESVEVDNFLKGRAWIAVSLRDDSLISYIQCLVSQSGLNKYYENWSILRSNDSCNRFLSILSGLDNVIFLFKLEHLNKQPSECNFRVKKLTEENEIIPLNFKGSKGSINLTASSTSLTSPVDSGVHIQDSASDMEQLLEDKQTEIDFLNGNIPETVFLRKSKKNSKRHVSFHEDIIYKSPEKCRKLKWDSENLRYSWSGEQLDSSILKEVDFRQIKNESKSSTPVKSLDLNERGAPEGEETPSSSEYSKQINKSHKSVIVRRFLQSINKQTKIRQLHKKSNSSDNNFVKIKINPNLVSEINNEIKRELDLRPKILISKNEVCLNVSMVRDMIKSQSVYKTYKLRDFLFIITNANVYLINKNLETRRISFKNLIKITVYPDCHVFLIHESDDECHTFVTGDSGLTEELLGRLELAMRRNHFDPPVFTMLHHDDLNMIKNVLIEKLAIGKTEELVYCGAILIDKENDLLSSVLPSSKRGFLMYKDLRAGDCWIPGDFCLKNGMLYLFEDDSSFPKLAVNIANGCESCHRTKNSDRPHTFQISLRENELEMHPNLYSEYGWAKSKHPRRLLSGIRQKMNKLLTFGGTKGSGCVIEFAAANEFELSEWLQMIIQASCADYCEEAHKEELTEATLWLTSKSLVITNEIYSLQTDIEIISCAQLQDVAAFRMGETEKDFFTVIEFVCMEASSTSGDWILYLSSRKELEKLKSTLQNLWKLKIKFPFDYLREGRLNNRCRKSQDNLTPYYWSQFLQ